MKHGHLTVLRELKPDNRSIRRYECVCWCGAKAVLRSNHFYPTRLFCTRSCPLLAKHRSPDLAGRRFGRWTVIGHAGSSGRLGRWSCLCDCGKKRSVITAGLTSGTSQSCGCLLRDNRSTGRTPEEEAAVKRMRCRIAARKNPARVKANKIKYESKLSRATPRWLTEEDWKTMNALYEDARRLSKETGIKHQVDHIIPINGDTVSGLHVPSNLQILTQSQNVAKSNRYADLSGD